MFDFHKKITYEDYKQAAFEGFLLSCPAEVRKHILLCVSCQELFDPLFRPIYDVLMDDKIFDLSAKINKDIIKHIKENRKLNKNV